LFFDARIFLKCDALVSIDDGDFGIYETSCKLVYQTRKWVKPLVYFNNSSSQTGEMNVWEYQIMIDQIKQQIQ
jgi:hypothetical protein